MLFLFGLLLSLFTGGTVSVLCLVCLVSAFKAASGKHYGRAIAYVSPLLILVGLLVFALAWINH